MAETRGVRKYLYWSERRIRAFAEDNSISLVRRATAVKTPSVPFLPQAESTWESRPLTRHEIAGRLEKALGSEAVAEFVTPSPVRFAKGHGTITLSEFPNANSPRDEPAELGIAAIMVPVAQGDDRKAGVCLFGSLSNFADFITDSVPRRTGWSSSAGPGVMRAIQNRCRLPPENPTAWPYDPEAIPETVAVQAANVAFGQGEAFGAARRGFTYGEINEVGEWMAEVWLDIACPHEYGWLVGPADSKGNNAPLHRLLIGAPMWIRTPSVRAVHLYDEASGQLNRSARRPLRSRVARAWRVLRDRPPKAWRN